MDCLRPQTSKEPGLSEEFVGSLLSFFPLHHESELEFLKRNWGGYHLICQPWILGKTEEGMGTKNYFRASMDDKHFSATYVPLDTIRDYFGEHVGLYSAWLMLYTRSLAWPAGLGLCIQIYQAASPELDASNNWLMIPYSVFLCVWSASFNSRWRRRENELKFLWGSEETEAGAPVRDDFKGVLIVDPVTEDEEIQYYSATARAVRLMLSTGVSLGVVLTVIFLAFSATTVRYKNAPDPDDVYCYEVLTYEGPLVVNGTQMNETDLITGLDTGIALIVNISDHFKVKYVFTKAECQALAEPKTEDVFDTILSESGELISVTHHVDSQEVIHTSWVDGWPPNTSNFDKNKFGWLSALLNTVMIVVFGMLYEKCAIALTDWENHRTQIEYEDQLILKNFGFQFVNNYFVLFYIGYMRQIDTSAFGGPDVRVTECRGGTCLGQLQTQIVVVFTTKTMIAQLTEIFAPRLKAASAEARRLLRIKDLQNLVETTAEIGQKGLSLALTAEQNEMMGMDADSIAHDKAMRKKQEEMEMRLAAAVSDDSHSAAERESYLLEYESTFDDFNEMAIQFGYLALFSPVYPLAAFLALLNNILEVRVDAAKMCYATRRPTWTAAADIGSWFVVMNALGFIAVITNATMITFVGKLLANSEEAAQGGLSARKNEWSLWFIAVCVEHSMLILRVLILTLGGEVPFWIGTAKKQLLWHQDNMKPGRQLLEELELHAQFKEKYDVAADECAHELHPDVQSHLLTQNSIHAHMSSRGHGPVDMKAVKTKKRDAALAAIARGESAVTSSSPTKGGDKGGKTVTKVSNPMQGMDMPSDSDSESDDDRAHPTAAIYSDGGFDADGHQVRYKCVAGAPIRFSFDADSDVTGFLR